MNPPDHSQILSFSCDNEVEVTWPSTETLRRLDVDGGSSRKSWIDEVDISGCPNIERMNLGAVDITELDVTHLKKLEHLFLSNVDLLEDLDVSGCPVLRSLTVGSATRFKTFTGNGKVFPLKTIVHGMRTRKRQRKWRNVLLDRPFIVNTMERKKRSFF